MIDLAMLEQKLLEYANRPLKIGSFSAASNVTGIESDTRAVATVLHKHGALSLWDYAAAGPYVKMEMNPPGDDAALAYKDAIFLSPHKLIGGPGTPGVLVAKRALFKNRVPSVPGGGTVAYVNQAEHRYLEDPEHREEGGTPAIIESIRAGLVFQLKEAVTVEAIQKREHSFIRRAIESWEENPNIQILGNRDAKRLSIVSFVIRHCSEVRTSRRAPHGIEGRTYLHHGFVAALLNDLLGIQARSGCSCAGPYGHRLLGIDLARSREFEREIVRGCEGVKPGWVRVNFNYFISEHVFDFILKSIHLVAEHGWRLLPDYRFIPETGQWLHRNGHRDPPMRLFDVCYRTGKLEYRSAHIREPEWALETYLDEAERILLKGGTTETIEDAPLSEDFEALRWFTLPAEAQRDLSESGLAGDSI
jgi:selenocysteine lyase/cysteine desulfurase